MTWNNFHGGYANTGNYDNVILGGNPNNTGDFGVPLTTAHANNVGYGIQFSANGNLIKFELNLIGYAVNASGVYVPNLSYVQFGGIYRYYFKVSLSNNNGSSYTDIFNQVIFNHGDTWDLAYKGNWLTTAQNSQYSRSFSIPDDTTHVRVELYGENAVFPYANIYPISIVKPDFRPWGVRKSNIVKSCNNDTGFTRIRKNGNFQDIPKMLLTQQGQANVGTSRIRKGGIWVGQSKVGN